MIEEEQYAAWQEASIGYWCHPLQAYDNNPVWTADPKHTPYKDVMRNALPQSYKGPPSEAAAAVKADFVIGRHVPERLRRPVDARGRRRRGRAPRQALFPVLAAGGRPTPGCYSAGVAAPGAQRLLEVLRDRAGRRG